MPNLIETGLDFAQIGLQCFLAPLQHALLAPQRCDVDEARADLRRVVDYRAGFARIDGRWRMIVFVAGD